MSIIEQSRKVAVCLKDNAGMDLLRGREYQLLPDAEAQKNGMLRVVDESGEGCYYPANWFLVRESLKR